MEKAQVNYLDMKMLEPFVRYYDVIVNCSGYTGRPNVDAAEKEKDKCWELNTVFPAKLANLVTQHNKKLIHLSTGCMYTGYDKPFSEADAPNFGVFNPDSSFYSKSKHAARTLIEGMPNVWQLQLRMPHSPDKSERNYLMKLKNYQKLINLPNSRTSVTELATVISQIARSETDAPAGVYNITNDYPLDMNELVELYKKYNLQRDDWELVDDISKFIVANRSNCILNSSKANRYFKLSSDHDAIEQSLYEISKL